MECKNKAEIAKLVKECRTAKGYTQQELSENTGISLRSIQRIENAEVLPRMYTVKLLSQYLNFTWKPQYDSESACEAIPDEQLESRQSPIHLSTTQSLNKVQKLILTMGIGIILALLVFAFLAQSRRFPETDFEMFLLLTAVTGFYTLILLTIWK